MTTKFGLYSTLVWLLASALGAQAAETGVSDSEIRIGQFAAQTGPAAELGKRMQLGILAHFTAINSAGGIHGRKLTLISRDDGYEPEKAIAAVKALIEEDKVFALIGSVGTPTTLAAIPAINAEGIPLIGPFTGAQALREPLNRNLFHVRASYFDETERIVQHLSTLGIKKIAVFYQNDSYGKAGLEGVIQISAYKSCAALIKQARAKSYGGQFFNVSFVGSKALADELGEPGAGVTISQVVPFPYIPSLAIVREYQQRMTEAGNKDFDFSSMEGFLAAKVFTEGLRKAGKKLSRESFTTALESLRDYNLGGFTVNYSAKSHEGSRYTDLTIIGRGGKFVR